MAKITEAQAREAYEIYGSYRAAGKALSVSDTTVIRWCDPEARARYSASTRKYNATPRGQESKQKLHDKRVTSGKSATHARARKVVNAILHKAWYAANRDRKLRLGKMRKITRKQLGLCYQCPIPAIVGKTHCELHREAQRQRRAAKAISK